MIDLTGEKTGAFIRPYMGEFRSGDAVVVKQDSEGTFLAIIDALGHGSGAAIVAERVSSFLKASTSTNLVEIVKMVDELLKGGGSASGAALGLCFVDNGGSVRYVGVGNTTARVISSSHRQFHFVSKDGTAGQVFPTPVEQNATVQSGDLIVFTTDGVKSHIDPETESSILFSGSAYKVATEIVQKFGKQHDDAACLVYRHD